LRLTAAANDTLAGDEPRSDPQAATASDASATTQRKEAVNVFPVGIDAKPDVYGRRKSRL
jgi:hypothetical protein